MDKAKESDMLKSAFLANMSHEIRTPMNIIIGFSQLLSEPQHSETEKKEFIEAIQGSSKRLLKTVNDILEISKIETGQMDLFLSEFNLCQKSREIANSLKVMAEERDLEFVVDTELDSCNFVVHSDENKVESVLTNILQNAVKFSEHGKIHLGLRRKNEDFLEFYCRDCGVGIEKDRIHAIFNRFEQADIKNKNAFEGSGLGLAISKAYLELLGGSIRVESKFGHGSTFFVTLPVNYKK